MPNLKVELYGDGCWPELAEKGHQTGELVAVALLEKGTAQGRPTVTFRIELPDGGTLLVETTWRLLDFAYGAIKASIERRGLEQ
jgi:hypothetical protein